MFEAAELGRKISRNEYEKLDRELHVALLDAQRKLDKTGVGTIILVSGVEGAGKGEVLNCLNRWFDTRQVTTSSYWAETEDELRRPPYWRFWRDLPPRGKISLLFGSWYSSPIVKHIFGANNDEAFERDLRLIQEFERMLVEDGLLLVKLWFHLPEQELRKRVAKMEDPSSHHLSESPLMKTHLPHYDDFSRASERAIRLTDRPGAHWHIIEASDDEYRNARAGQLILGEMQNVLAEQESAADRSKGTEPAGIVVEEITNQSILDNVVLDRKAGNNAKQELARWQAKLNELAWEAHARKKSIVAVFEGWDAAGKGSAIRRVIQAVDARLCKVISIGAPTDEEKARQYLWRFWRHIPLSGSMTIYDRSWYGRVLVERVEGFASNSEWKRAYHEINHYEEQLIDSGISVCKFWLHIDQKEQLKRFRERENTPWKQHKITPDDWRNREKWDDYKMAVTDMVTHTSTDIAPWHLIPANDKKYARIEIVKLLCLALEDALGKNGWEMIEDISVE